MSSLQERIKIAGETQYGTSNCMITALFISGSIKSDHAWSCYKARELLSSLEVTDSPEPGDIIVFYNDGTIAHAGVVTETNPLKYCERMGITLPFFTDRTKDDMSSIYERKEFRKPRDFGI